MTREPTVDRAADVARTIRRATIASIAVGVILSPIPLADELVLLPGYGVLTARIARAHGLSLAEVPWRPIAVTAVAGLGARAAVNVTVSYIPFVAAAANAASAVALTQFMGRYVDTACENASQGRATEALGWKEVVDRIRATRSGAPT